MSVKHIALIRGINVGRAKRVAMADLRALLEELGYSDVRTILNSGNAVFSTSEEDTMNSASHIEKVLYEKTGVSARVMVFTEAELIDIVRDNSLSEVAIDPSRLLITFVQNPSDLIGLKSLEQKNWDPEVLVIGRRAAYLWCPDGVLESQLSRAVGRVLGDAATTRNWSTVMKIYALNK